MYCMGALAPMVLESVGTSTPIRVSEPVGGRCAHAPLFSEPLNEAFEKILEVKVKVLLLKDFLQKRISCTCT